MISTCRPFHHIKPPSLGDILPAVTLSMWGSVKSTRRPLRTRFGVIFSAAALSMGGGVNIHTPPPSNAFWNNPFHGGVVDGGRCEHPHAAPSNSFWNNLFRGSIADGGRCDIHTPPLRSRLLALFESASPVVSTPSCCFEFQFPSCTSYFQLNIFMLFNFGDLD